MKNEAPAPGPSPASLPPAKGWRRTFVSLRNRNFRWFWLGILASFTAMQMDMFARGWLVFRMTGSTLALGTITAAWGIPVLALSPLGGVVTDRVGKRNLLIATQAWVGIITLVLAGLIITGAVAFWYLFIGVLLVGIAWAFNMPGRQAFIPELVAPEELMNAIALNSAGMNLTGIAAPAVAGYLVGVIDVGGVYILIVVCYLLAILSLLQIPSSISRDQSSDTKASRSLWSEMGDGFRYIKANPAVTVLLAMALVYSLFGMLYQSFLPVFAVEIYNVGAQGMGLLMGVSGLGALVGSLGIASLGTSQHKGELLIGSGLAAGASLFLFAITPSFLSALGILFFLGMAGTSYFAINNTLIISHTPQEVLGRVMSIYMMTFGMMPFAALPAGAIAEVVGVSLTIAVSSAFLVVFFLAILLLYPAVRRLN